MKTDVFINQLNSDLATKASTAKMLEWVNMLEQSLYRSNLMELELDLIDAVAVQSEYSLATKEYKFEDIEALYVDGELYNARYATTPPYNGTYVKTTSGFALSPTPLTSVAQSIEVHYKKRPALKTEANMDTEDLTILADFGEEFISLYRYYCYRMISIVNRDYNDANLYGTLYQEAEDAFWEWYVNRQPDDMAIHRKRRWR